MGVGGRHGSCPAPQRSCLVHAGIFPSDVSEDVKLVADRKWHGGGAHSRPLQPLITQMQSRGGREEESPPATAGVGAAGGRVWLCGEGCSGLGGRRRWCLWAVKSQGERPLASAAFQAGEFFSNVLQPWLVEGLVVTVPPWASGTLGSTLSLCNLGHAP